MKKLLFVLFLLVSVNLFAADTYCYMILDHLVEGKFKVYIDYGTEDVASNKNYLKGDDGKPKEFVNIAQLLNYMSGKGWEFVQLNDFHVKTHSSLVTTIIMKKSE